MKPRRLPFLSCLVFLISLSCAWAQTAKSPAEIFGGALQRLADIIEPAPGQARPAVSTSLEVIKADGVPAELLGETLQVNYQAPDKLRVEGELKKRRFVAGRNGQQVWIYTPQKQFGVVGETGQVRFASAPNKIDTTKLGDFKLPLRREQLALLPLLTTIEIKPDETIQDAACYVLEATAKPEAVSAFKLPKGVISLWIRQSDMLPLRVGYADGAKLHVVVALNNPTLEDSSPMDTWIIPAREGDQVQQTALSHVTRFFPAILETLTEKIPPLGPATGERRVVATEGRGRLEMIDGTRVLVLEGTPEEMGHQHGVLLKKEIRDMIDHVLYGVGVGSSFEKGRWFFGEIEQAQSRLNPFIDPRYLREMDAIALATGHEREEMRLANFFPELFHCSGFALFGEATEGGRLYHGRILDYLKGVGLEQNAVVIVSKPDEGNAWVNVSYAGFVGSVTAMNEKQLAIGEMGGRGEGNWDGKPMAQLVREVMEKANTIDEAVEIMRKGPRTCEYYYVISDAKSHRAVGIAATPTKFETVWAGESHPQLPHPIKDTVLLSAGDRYLKLVERVKEGYGKFGSDTARELMRRPVAMQSCIHAVLFAPDNLDFWVANADSQNPASHTRYTHYNLRELLKAPPAATTTALPAATSKPGGG